MVKDDPTRGAAATPVDDPAGSSRAQNPVDGVNGPAPKPDPSAAIRPPDKDDNKGNLPQPVQSTGQGAKEFELRRTINAKLSVSGKGQSQFADIMARLEKNDRQSAGKINKDFPNASGLPKQSYQNNKTTPRNGEEQENESHQLQDFRNENTPESDPVIGRPITGGVVIPPEQEQEMPPDDASAVADPLSGDEIEDGDKQQTRENSSESPNQPPPPVPTAPTGDEPQPENPFEKPLEEKGKDKIRELIGKQKLAGKASSKIWSYGFATASAVLFSGLDLMLGALIMDLYWVLGHRKNKDLFPLSKWQKILTILANILPPIYILVLGIIVIAVGCNSSLGGVSGSLQNLGVSTFPGEVCQAVNSQLSNVTSVVTGSVPAGSVGGPLGLSSDINQKINSFAGQVDLCMLKVVVQKESGGQPNVIGCDCKANGRPQMCTDTSRTYYPGYQFNWDSCSYGIGLTQWTIYPKGGSGYKSWKDAFTPSRNILGSYYGVTDLLNPDTSLDLSAKKLQADYNNSKGVSPRDKVQDAFGAYVGQSSQTAALVANRMVLYDLCVSSGSLP